MVSGLTIYSSVAGAVSALLHPHAEVVLHDLRTGRIAGIWNAFSGRRVGDESLLDDGTTVSIDVLGPYEKAGPRGERLKSVTAALPDPAGGPPLGLLCINLDVSRLDEAMCLLGAFIAPREERPVPLFRNDWRERIQLTMKAWLDERGLSIKALTRAERIALVGALDVEHLFETRHAAEHVAQLLGASRASIYSYLAAFRKDGRLA